MRRPPLSTTARRAAAVATAVAALALAPAASADTLGGVTLPPSGGVRTTGPTVLSGQPGPTVSGRRGVLIGDRAYAPSKAPTAVKRVIWAANRIRHKPYKWGGGHGSWNDSGYDCSGAVSYALHGGGLLASPLDSRGFMRWGSAGPGRWITVYARDGHAWMIVAGLQFNTSGAGEHGPRWRPEPPRTAGFVARHPAGL
jgi:cell wall-associated NlpC family hydrolase